VLIFYDPNWWSGWVRFSILSEMYILFYLISHLENPNWEKETKTIAK